MTDKKEMVCVKRSSFGECIEWKEFGDTVIPVFRESDKECHPELYEKWKKSKKALMPSD